MTGDPYCAVTVEMDKKRPYVHGSHSSSRKQRVGDGIDTGYQQVGDKLEVSNVRRVCHVFPCNSSVILFDFCYVEVEPPYGLSSNYCRPLQCKYSSANNQSNNDKPAN